MDSRGWLTLVAREVEAAIDEAGLPTGYGSLLRLGLAEAGKVLSSNPSSRWPLLTLGSCEAASGGRWEHAIPAAAAMEVFIAALDLLDDLQDGDADGVIATCGEAQALNVSTGLLMLSQRMLLRLSDRGVGAETVLAVGRELAGAALTVGGGQHLDLAHESRPTISEQEALDVASRKSATLVSCACRIGARLGSDDLAVVDLLGRFGWHAGMAAQLINDLSDVAPGHPPKSDVRRGKKTLPLVSAATFGLITGSAAPPGDELAFREALAQSGALHYTWVVADMHRQQAADLLAELGPERPIEGLLGLLPRA